MGATPKSRRRESAVDRLRRLRGELAEHAADLNTPEVAAAGRELGAAEQAGRELPDAGHPDHLRRSRRLDRARSTYRQATAAVGVRDDQRRLQLRHELRQAEEAARRDARRATSRMLEAAIERAEADPRSVEHAAADFDHLRAGMCRLKVDDDPDLRLTIEAIRDFAPIRPGEAVIAAIGAVSQRARDRRPATVICHLRADGAALVAVPVDRLERLPEGVKAR